MSVRPELKIAESSEELSFGPRGELRESFGETGRVHLDRWLPFLVLHRTDSPEESIGRRVAVNSPAYLIWSPAEDMEAQAALEVVLERLNDRLGSILLVEVEDAPAEHGKPDSPTLPPFDIRVAATAAEAARSAMASAAEASRRICVDLRSPEVSTGTAGEPLLRTFQDADRIEIRIPQIQRSPEGAIYPELTQDLTAGLVDAVLEAAAAYMGATSNTAPPHFRSLGRSAFLAAALKADKKLDAIARSFDFLLSITPINMSEAKVRFLDGGEERLPDFRYRPLSIDPDLVKRELYAIDLSLLEDMLLEDLLRQKRHEIDMQLTMLAARNTSGFRPASMFLYGTVSSDLLKKAKAILTSVTSPDPRQEKLGAGSVAAAAHDLVEHYRSVDGRFDPRIEVRDDVFGLLVSQGRLMISSDSEIARNRLDALLAHEVSVHLLTYFNGATQGLTIFRTGLARYEGIQEGLGVFAEWAVGGLTRARLRLLAGRVVAVDAMIDGAGFVDVYRLLRDDFGFGRRGAFDITARVFRSGGLAKDAIYLKGFLEIIERVATGADLDAFWLGKIAPEHVDAVEELLLRELLHAPVFVPEFLSRADAQERIERLRGGESFDRLLNME